MWISGCFNADDDRTSWVKLYTEMNAKLTATLERKKIRKVEAANERVIQESERAARKQQDALKQQEAALQEDAEKKRAEEVAEMKFYLEDKRCCDLRVKVKRLDPLLKALFVGPGGHGFWSESQHKLVV